MLIFTSFATMHVGAGDGSGADFNDKKGAEEYTVVFLWIIRPDF